jgi:hypothetical protein
VGRERSAHRRFINPSANIGTGSGGLTCWGSADELGSLIRPQLESGRDIRVLEPAQWDVRGEYKDVVEAVREAVGGGQVGVYRVERAGARVEYLVLGVNEKKGKLEGVKALAVES